MVNIAIVRTCTSVLHAGSVESQRGPRLAPAPYPYEPPPQLLLPGTAGPQQRVKSLGDVWPVVELKLRL